MSPPGALPGITTIAETGAKLATGTQAHVGEITGHSAGIGGGTLGQAFRTGHQPMSEVVLAAAEQLPPVFQHLGAAGTTAVSAYVEADQRSADGFGQ